MKFALLSATAIEPVRATKFSAGYDFYTDESVTFEPNEVKIVKTGVTFKDMKSNQFLQMVTRSSISLSYPFNILTGTIDADYEGYEIGIIVHNRMPNMRARIDKGTKMAQGILLTYSTVEDEKTVTKKRIGGFGSTDTQE